MMTALYLNDLYNVGYGNYDTNLFIKSVCDNMCYRFSKKSVLQAIFRFEGWSREDSKFKANLSTVR